MDAPPVDGPGLAALGEGCSYHVNDWYGLAGRRQHVSADGMIAVQFSGRLLNEDRLRQAAGSAAPAGCSLEQVLAVLYEKRGESLLRDLNGPFILAIADNARKSLLLARDQHGQKFCFMASAGRTLLVQRQSADPAAMPGLPDETNFQALADYLALGYIPAPATIWARTQQTAGRSPGFSDDEWQSELPSLLATGTDAQVETVVYRSCS